MDKVIDRLPPETEAAAMHPNFPIGSKPSVRKRPVLITRMHSLAGLLLLGGAIAPVSAEEFPVKDKKQSVAKESRVSEKEEASKAQPFNFQIREEVEQVLVPLIESIRDAEVSRVSVEMVSDALMSGQVVSHQKATFQIAAKKPNRYTIYLKEAEQRTRVFRDDKMMLVAMAPDAFFKIKEPLSIQEAVTNLPVPLGPYPEPLLALSMASADPAISLIAGMRSINVVDRKPFKGKIPAVHLRGVQGDLVVWDLWVTDEKPGKPLRMLLDLTPMLKASDQVHVPEGYSHQVRYDFLSWRVSGKIDHSLFTFKPASNAIQYDSLEHYFDSVAGATGYHPLLGKPAPAFIAKTFGKKPYDSRRLKGRIVVLDFWATWCAPCLESLPILKKVTDEFAKKNVVFIAINTGEEIEEVRKFLKKEQLPISVLLDPDGKIADGFVVDAIPQTVVIGRDGFVEAVHLGFADEESLVERLRDELEVLTVGGRIGSIKQSKENNKEPKTKQVPRKREK